MKTQTLILLCMTSALSLGGCGKLGTLERPGPSGGADAGPEPLKASRTVDPRDRNSDPSPSVSSADAPPEGSGPPRPQ